MNGAVQIIREHEGGAGSRRAKVLTHANRFARALLVAFLVFAGTPIAASHAKAHYASDSQTQLSLTMVVDAVESDPGTNAPPLGGSEQHACSCPCLDPFPTRSHYVSAFLEGTRVRYPSYLDALKLSYHPDPVRKPPRLSARA